MSIQAGEGNVGQARANRSSRRRARTPLPVVTITSAYGVAAVLARHGGILRAYARHYLGSEEEVEAVLGAAVDWLLAQETPAHEHGMRYATQALMPSGSCTVGSCAVPPSTGGWGR